MAAAQGPEGHGRRLTEPIGPGAGGVDDQGGIDGEGVGRLRWLQAYDAGVAAPVVLSATSERALDVVPLEALRSHSVDVPPDLSAWE